jgi:demethylmenaquinone methyltransferase/2-methoxy-6-polyprenyl-1,4-benzoquinol methylase
VTRGAGKVAAPALFSGIATGYERRGAILSLGQDPRWRSNLVSLAPVGPEAETIDVATGTGAVASRMVQRYGCRVVGVDQSPSMLAEASRRLDERGLADRVDLVTGEAERLPFEDGRFDALTVTYLLRYVDDPAAVLAELVRVMRPGAPLASLEFGVPRWGLARAVWRAHVEVGVPTVGLAIGGRPWWEAGRFLARSIPEFWERYPLGELLRVYSAAGLVDVRAIRPTLGAAVIVTGRRAGGSWQPRGRSR